MTTDLYTTLQTQRTKLIPIQLSDSDFIYELVNTIDWKKYIVDRNVSSTTDAKNYITKIKTLPNTFFWTVLDTTTKIPIGIITLMKRPNFDYFDLGFAFLDNFKNKGYAFEASKAIINALQLNSHIDPLYAITLKENHNSIKLLEKLQFSLLKEFTENEENLLLYQIQLNEN